MNITTQGKEATNERNDFQQEKRQGQRIQNVRATTESRLKEVRTLRGTVSRLHPHNTNVREKERQKETENERNS